MQWTSISARSLCAALLGSVLSLTPSAALIQPETPTDPMADKTFQHADLQLSGVYVAPSSVNQPTTLQSQSDLGSLNVAHDRAFLDQRTGRWGALLMSEPLIPGTGRNNSLTTAPLQANGLQHDRTATLEQQAWSALSSYLGRNRTALRIDPTELANPARITQAEHLIQIHAPRIVDGIPVRNSYITAVLNRGNLVLLGMRNWADVDTAARPTIDRQQAMQRTANYLETATIERQWRKPHLVFVPSANGSFLKEPPFGQGLTHRLAWVISPKLAGDERSFEVLVDAHSGEMLSMKDQNHYASTRTVVGGVYPASNDGAAPDGVEQANWPMPFADVLTQAGEQFFTDGNGNLNACVDDRIGTRLAGRYVAITDNCGTIADTSTGSINLGTSGGDDCTVPAGGSAGNTHSARSGYYELNRIKEQARGQLPDNSWLKEQLPAIMNIDDSCNAFWNGSSVNFYRSGGGCGNTGELAGVFDHEWGHGMDNFDVNPSISNPGEGIADIYAALRLNDSCIGRGFLSGNCGGYGDSCLDCTGVRDIDWANRTSGEPHDLAWIDANCGTGDDAPCGGSVHCEGAVYSEAIWDLFNRDLQTVPYNFDFNTAIELATRLTYQGAGPVGQWYNCTDGTGLGDGCNADGGYLNFLVADDDDGDLSNGTPHMTAIFNAFDRHGIACAVPAVQDSGCAGGPSIAPAVAATATDRGTQLSWQSVPGATAYEIFRTDGVFGCDYGKTKVGTTTDLAFHDGELLNGREYYYTVAAIGSSASCLGPMSACTTVTPVPGPNLAIASESAALEMLSGDDDVFLDNCEEARVSFDITSTGTGSQTNLRIVGLRSPSHPQIVFTSELPIDVAPSFASCDIASGEIEMIATGLGHDETVEIEVTVTSDELFPLTVSELLSFGGSESDFTSHANKVFSYENDLEGWSVKSGSFSRSTAGGGGADGTPTFVTSSANLDSQCDQVVSPLVRLAADSTLSLYNKYDIEDIFTGTGAWYDRANVGIVDASGTRSAVSPDSGRPYDASGANGTCGTTGQPGFAGTQANWAQSGWSAAALGSAEHAGELVRLAVHYGTDSVLSGVGFSFDELELTNFELQTPDGQGNSCDLPDDTIFADGFNSGDTSAWSKTAGNVEAVTAGLGSDGGSHKLAVTVDGGPTKSYVQSSHPSSEKTFTLSFVLDANAIDLGSRSIEVVRLYNSDSLKMAWLKLRRVSADNYKVRFFQLDDNSTLQEVGKTSVAASGTTAITIEWQAASVPGANDGVVRVLRSGKLKIERSDLDIDGKSVGAVRLGLPKGSAVVDGIGGTFYVDEYSSKP